LLVFVEFHELMLIMKSTSGSHCWVSCEIRFKQQWIVTYKNSASFLVYLTMHSTVHSINVKLQILGTGCIDWQPSNILTNNAVVIFSVMMCWL
jgi:hypothetical protein